MKTLYFVRHGQTLFNRQKKIQGWCDSPLTDLGIRQAEYTGNYFKEKGIVFDHAYSSTSERCSDTLELMTDMNYTRLKGLKEWNFGEFEGKDECLNPKGAYGDFFVPYGGESQEEIRERIDTTIRGIMDQSDHQNVLIVSHGGALINFFLQYEEYCEFEFSGEMLKKINGGFIKFEYENGLFKPVDIFFTDQVK